MRWALLLLVGLVSVCTADLHSVEGTVVFARGDSDLPANTRILLNHGKYVGFPRDDGTFRIDGVQSGSYVVQVENVDYVFEPIRVDIASSGKTRARRLSVLRPTEVSQLPYPLKMAARDRTRYFRKREEWRLTDMLLSPMVLMVAVPLLIMLVLPKLTANDPEMQREMENMQLPKMDMPDVSEYMANLFGGGPPKNKKKAVTAGSSGTQKRR